MTLSPELRSALRALVGADPLVYVDCGARAGKLPRAFKVLDHARYIGFDADAEECARLNAAARPGRQYVCAFLGRTHERRTFHVTSNPACSSLLAPNMPLLSAFLDLGAAFHVEREIAVETVPLAGALREQGVTRVDFLELDTQGCELEILEGAVDLLGASVAGVQVEVELSPMYVDQPLFADVDPFMRRCGFQLFDLSRYRARRHGLDAGVSTRGQLLWGHALYLRSHHGLSTASAARLAAVATLVDAPDYAEEILARMCRGPEADDWRARALRVREALAQAPVDPKAGDALLASRHKSLWRD